ncbi:MAG TPA: hypothetical protein VE641_07285 [Chthoniobacterales bacterium]|nr:hypothetical protein [Chthoniobacterales bacterium]
MLTTGRDELLLIRGRRDEHPNQKTDEQELVPTVTADEQELVPIAAA